MTLEMVRTFLLWSTLINYGLLITWYLLFVFAHDFAKSLNDKAMGRKIANFDVIHYSGIALYKLGIIFFNLVPWLVLTALMR